MSTTPTYITEVLHLVTLPYIAVLNDCYREEMAYTMLAYSYSASLHDVYACLHHIH